VVPVDLTNHVVRVRLGEESDRLVVTLSQPMSGFTSIPQMFEASVDGVNWIAPYILNNDDPLNIIFFMSDDVATATQWRVPQPGNWQFVDGEPMVGPMSGEIE
jgi:hypothetical protein